MGTVIKKKTNITRDFFFISNEKDTKCIKMLFTVAFFFFHFDGSCLVRANVCLKSEEFVFVFNSF